MSYGLKFVEPTKEDYKQYGRVRLGGVALQPLGQWDAFVPKDEVQNLAMEPSACASFGTLNCVEALLVQEFGVIINWSDRFLAKMSGTTQEGNDPNTVAETLRKKGNVYEDDWPYTKDINTWEKYYAPIPMQVQTDAQVKFRGAYEFGHSWVHPDPASMMEALKYSPLGVDVYAWQLGEKYYHRAGTSNHWCMLYGYQYGDCWKIFDSYSNTHKKLEWDFGFTMVKQYTLHKQVLDNSLWAKAIRWLQQFI